MTQAEFNASVNVVARRLMRSSPVCHLARYPAYGPAEPVCGKVANPDDDLSSDPRDVTCVWCKRECRSVA